MAMGTEDWTVDNFKRKGERNPSDRGEVDLHSHNAIDSINEMAGTPVDGTTPPSAFNKPQETKVEKASSVIQPPAPGRIRILLVIPILNVSKEFFESFMKFWSAMIDHVKLWDGDKLIGAKYEIGYYFVWRKSIHIADTMGALAAQTNQCTHVLYMDDDIYDITPQMVDVLLAADKDVISAVMYTSGFPYSMCTFRRYNVATTVASQPAQTSVYRLYEVPCRCPHCTKAGSTTQFNTWGMDFCPICKQPIKDFAVQPVDLIPFPFTLIKMSVFDRIRKPWFHCNLFFPPDSWFADRCIEAGIQQYARMDMIVNHRGVNPITRPHLFARDMALNRQKGSMVELTPEQMKAHEHLVEEKMTEAEQRMRLSKENNPTFAGMPPVEGGGKDVKKENS